MGDVSASIHNFQSPLSSEVKLSVSQSVSSTLVGLATRYYFPSEELEFQSYFATDSRSVSMSLCRAPLWDLRPDITSHRNSSKFKVTLQLTVGQSVSQYVLVSGTLVGLPVGIARSSKLLYDWRSVSVSWYRAPLWDLRPDITSCPNVALWKSWSCFCGALSPTRGRICNLQHNPSRAEPVTVLYCLIWDPPPSLEGQVPVFVSPRNRVVLLRVVFIWYPAGRTFPNHTYFSSPLGPGQLALFNLLKAYSLLDPEVGYCQGLSFVAGVLLLHVSD
jgi:hypothetical protein